MANPILGLDDYIKDMQSMGDVADLAVEKAINKALEFLLPLLKAAAPVYEGPPRPDVEPGFLKDSIDMGQIRETLKGVISNVVGVTDRAAWYGIYREFGTRHEPQVSWFRPVIDTNINQIMQIMEDTIVEEITKFYEGG